MSAYNIKSNPKQGILRVETMNNTLIEKRLENTLPPLSSQRKGTGVLCNVQTYNTHNYGKRTFIY